MQSQHKKSPALQGSEPRANTLLRRAGCRLWEDRFLWLSCAVLVLLFYGFYLQNHYSPDTWSTAQYFREIDAAGYPLARKWELLYEPFAQQGRFVRGFMMFLLGVPNLSHLMVSNFANAVALGLFMCALVYTYKTLRVALGIGAGTGVSTQKPAPRRSYAPFESAESLLCFLGSAVLVCNPFFCDWLQFAECALLYPMGLLLAVLAARVFAAPGGALRRIATCGALLILAAGIYQITLQIFVLLAMTVVTVRAVTGGAALGNGAAQKGGAMAKQALWLTVQALLAYLCAALTQLLFTRVFYHNIRMDTDVANTLPLIGAAQGQLWTMQYLGAPTRLFALCVLVLALLGVGALVLRCARKRLSAVAVGVAAMAFLGLYAGIFVLMLISDGAIPHRTVVGFFGIPLFFAACLAAALRAGAADAATHTAPQSGLWQKRLRTVATWLACGALSVLLLFNWYHTQRISTSLLRSNAQDIQIARQIQECITQYERETGDTVTQVSFYRMPSNVNSYPDVFHSHDLGLRAWMPTWSWLPLLNTVNGTAYVQAWRDDLAVAHFGGKDWMEFHSDQVYCEDGVAVIAIF